MAGYEISEYVNQQVINFSHTIPFDYTVKSDLQIINEYCIFFNEQVAGILMILAIILIIFHVAEFFIREKKIFNPLSKGLQIAVYFCILYLGLLSFINHGLTPDMAMKIFKTILLSMLFIICIIIYRLYKYNPDILKEFIERFK